MENRLNINVSAIDYDKTSKALTQQLTSLEEMVHGEDDFIMTDSNSLDLAFNQWMWYNVGNGDNMYITSGFVLIILVIIWMGSRTDI